MYLITICCSVLLLLKFQADAESRSKSFAELRTSEWFVDKTLMIRDFLNEAPAVKLLTAPSRFGKTILMDMIKRFLSIQVDYKGNRIAPNLTQNYKLFCEPPLKICQDKVFVEKHLGQYPVVHISYKPLRTVMNLKNLQRRFRFVVSETFLEHQYLTRHKKLFHGQSDLSLFVRHFKKPIRKLRKDSLLHALKWLTQLLCTHFGKPVLVLLDDYDALCRTQLMRQAGHIDDVIQFLNYVTHNLFKDNIYLDRAIVTGILRVKDLGVSLSHNDLHEHRFLGDHKFSPYYGFTEEEIEELLQKNRHRFEDVEETRSHLAQFYRGYMIEKQNITIYSTWSAVQFFVKNETSDTFWYEKQYLNYLLHIFATELTVNISKSLLYEGTEVYGDISSSVTKQMVIALRKCKRDWSVPRDLERKWLLSYLFDFGFLTTSGISTSNKTQVSLQIPNGEIHLGFCTTLSEVYQHKYRCTPQDITQLDEIVNKKLGLKEYPDQVENIYQSTDADLM